MGHKQAKLGLNLSNFRLKYANFRALMGQFGSQMGQFDYQLETQIGYLEQKYVNWDISKPKLVISEL